MSIFVVLRNEHIYNYFFYRNPNEFSDLTFNHFNLLLLIQLRSRFSTPEFIFSLSNAKKHAEFSDLFFLNVFTCFITPIFIFNYFLYISLHVRIYVSRIINGVHLDNVSRDIFKNTRFVVSVYINNFFKMWAGTVICMKACGL